MAKVFVGMSGGVDSSVTAALLKQAGHDVLGVFIKVWEPPGEFGEVCTWREDRRDATRVAARLDIPLVTVDLSREYERSVVQYMIREYRSGRTPNPDVECNRAIKFGAFFQWAIKHGADFVATGHYARRAPATSFSASGQQGKVAKKIVAGYRLLAARDKNKDQSYFLWTLGQKELSRCLFPIGDYLKSEVRRLAKKFVLPNAAKKDSQGLCFLGRLDLKKFLQQYIKPKPGKVLDENGRVIGGHQGVWFYTVGEHHYGYIIKKDIRKNTLTVSAVSPAIIAGAAIKLAGVNWIAGQPPPLAKSYRVRLRHRGEFYPCRLAKVKSAWRVIFRTLPFAPAAGQSLVLYDSELCLGGGIIA